MYIGIIADDFTGATDAASFLVKGGLSVSIFNTIPTQCLSTTTDAIIIAQKTRSLPPHDAVLQSVQAAQWLLDNGCNQLYFKYCSTFDSTAEGNIGPITDALQKLTNSSFTLLCPALPINGRTVYQGYLFVNSQLLCESGMKDHPLTPMKDANLIRLMDKQSAKKTAVIKHQDIVKGVDAVKDAILTLSQQGYGYAVCDTITDDDLLIIAKAAQNLPLLTGGSGLVGALATIKSQRKSPSQKLTFSPIKSGVIFSASCSLQTNRQVEVYKKISPSYKIDVQLCLTDSEYPKKIAKWVLNNQTNEYFPMVYATVSSEELQQIQRQYGQETTSKAIEKLFYTITQILKIKETNYFIVAGGETSGVVGKALEAESFMTGQEIAPGVPWLKVLDDDIFITFKSGNFGNDQFFIIAQEMIKNG
ncbi:hypothetical protein GQP18_24410 [Vibrio parahaemolyticus]|nr:hypothetical protein [Vibrio parahaemolyticus]